MFYNSSFFKYTTGLILVMLVIFMFSQIGFFLEPFIKLLSVLFMPILLSVFFYYLLRPLVRFFQSKKIHKTVSILIVFFLLITVFTLFATYSTNIVIKQFQQLFNDLPQIAESARKSTTEILQSRNISLALLGNFQDQIAEYLQNSLPFIRSGILNALSTLTDAASVILIVPFILFYLLKDDREFLQKGLNKLPENFRQEVFHILKEADKTLSTYIIGQALIAFLLGLMMYIGYLIIDVDYSFLLGIFVMITAFIPIFGTIIGVVPAFLVALTISSFTGFKILILTIIVQQLEGNFISPALVGKRLAIHPLTIILIFIGATAVWGFIGMLIAIPAYAVMKVIFNGSTKIYSLIKNEG